MTFYNEFDPAWARRLRGLCEFGAIPQGVVSDADIRTLTPTKDVESYTQAHFFAGIGGWAEAFRIAGWPSDIHTWTGSCPCQPFSVAGKRKGFDDDRHVWPAWRGLIRDVRPSIVFGEQVSGAGGIEWFTRVRDDLEALGYAVGACDIPACSVGAPHRRQRLFFVAYASGSGLEKRAGGLEQTLSNAAIKGGLPGALGDTTRERCAQVGSVLTGPALWAPWADWTVAECLDGKARRIPTEPAFQPLAHGIPQRERVELLRGFGNAIVPQVAATFVGWAMEYLGLYPDKGAPQG